MLTTFGIFCICLLGWSRTTAAKLNEVNRPTVGVIRWDAWNLVNGHYDMISNLTYRYLRPERFHYRLPFFAKILSDTNITMDEDTQQVMDQEILFAKEAGLDYWAFDFYCVYGPNCTTNSSVCAEYLHNISSHYCPLNPTYGLQRYLSSQYVSLINFTLVLLGTTLCSADFQEYFIELMRHPHFHTVLGGRAILYLFQFGDGQAEFCGGGWAGTRRVIDSFREKAMQRGLKNPYLVLMDGNIPRCKNHTIVMGFDAISSYGLGGGGSVQGAPFSDEVQRSEPWWNSAVQSGAKVVIPLSTGWDPRPIHEIPGPSFNGSMSYFLQPTAEELQNFLKSAIELTCANRNVTEAQTIIVYAWNECSENGAALIPSIGNGTYYVRALSEILPMSC